MNVSVTFGNLGTAPATGVTYSLALPPGLTGVSCVGATCSYDSNTGSVTVTGLPGTLAPGQTVDITLNYTAPTSGSVTVTAGANAGNDSNPNNNSASGRTVIIGAPVDIPALTPTSFAGFAGSAVAGRMADHRPNCPEEDARVNRRFASVRLERGVPRGRPFCVQVPRAVAGKPIATGG